MSKLNLRGRLTDLNGTALLGSLCFGGALVYVVLVGISLLSWVPEPHVSTQAELSNTVDSSSLPDGPLGQLRIEVTTPDRAYVQHLDCTGDTDSDPQPCAKLASYEEEARHASAGTPESPFAEVAENATCTEKNYGPEKATITGTWQGERIETDISRGDSCEEARWQRLRPITDPITEEMS